MIRAIVVLLVFAANVASAQSYPNRPVRVIVPYPAGGSTDIMARIVSPELQAALGQPFVVENRAGGVTIIGTEAVARAPADGHTLLMTTSVSIVNTAVFRKIPYQLADFAPVAGVAKTPNVLVVNSALPARDLAEFVVHAKAPDTKLNNATLGAGSITHLLAERFTLAAGPKLFHIAYKGSGAALQDLLGGQVHSFFDSVATAAPHIRAGKARGLAITSEARSPAAPAVPTFKEQGFPTMVSYTWFGYLAPAGTPRAIVDRLAGAIQAALATPQMRAKLTEQGALPVDGGPADFERYIKEDLAEWAAVVKATGVRVD